MPKHINPAPAPDPYTFIKLATTTLAYLDVSLKMALPDFRSDRGPYVITAGVFHQVFLNIFERSNHFATAKMTFLPRDVDAQELCTELEEILEDFKNVFLVPMERIASDRAARFMTFVSVREAYQSLKIMCKKELPAMESLAQRISSTRKKWPPPPSK